MQNCVPLQQVLARPLEVSVLFLALVRRAVPELLPDHWTETRLRLTTNRSLSPIAFKHISTYKKMYLRFLKNKTCFSPVYPLNSLEILIRRAWERPGPGKRRCDTTKGPLGGPPRAGRKLASVGGWEDALLVACRGCGKGSFTLRAREAIKGKGNHAPFSQPIP